MSTGSSEMLRALPFLEGARPAVVEQLAREAVEVAYQPGEVILEEGSTGRDLYLVLAGQVEVVKGHGDDEMLLARRGPGDLLGEMAFIEECPRFATVRALEPTRLLALSDVGIRAALAQQPELLYEAVRVLSARLRESDLQMIADLQQRNRELARAYRKLQEAQAALVEKERLERELELARQIQQSILPRTFPEAPGFSVTACSRPAREVGGDFYDVILLEEGCIGLVMADVSDKGMAAALFMALTRSLIRAEAQRLVSPKETLLRVNRLLREMSQANMFITVFYGVLDPVQRTLCYARAGHDYPLLFRSAVGQCQRLGGEGTVLGLLDEIFLDEVSVDLAPGDVLALYTDGVTDARSVSGEFFGADRLDQALRSVGGRDAQQVRDTIFDQVNRFQEGAVQYDDTALLIVKMEAPG